MREEPEKIKKRVSLIFSFFTLIAIVNLYFIIDVRIIKAYNAKHRKKIIYDCQRYITNIT